MSNLPAYRAPAHRGTHSESTPAIDGLVFDRHNEQNWRNTWAFVAAVLGAGSFATIFFGVYAPVLLTAAAAIAGIVMGVRGRRAAKNGLASNGGLGLAAIILGVLTLAGQALIYALLLWVLASWT